MRNLRTVAKELCCARQWTLHTAKWRQLSNCLLDWISIDSLTMQQSQEASFLLQF